MVSSLFLQAGNQSAGSTLQSAFDSALGSGSVWHELDIANAERLGNVFSLATGTVAAANLTGIFTVGYVFWMAGGGVLVASLVSLIPAWKSF